MLGGWDDLSESSDRAGCCLTSPSGCPVLRPSIPNPVADLEGGKFNFFK